jgi:hypothetical protein
VRTPILVTGSHRSGTTWVGRMLCASGEAGYIHEPLNPNRVPSWTGGRVPLWFLYLCADNSDEYEPLLRDVLAFRYPLRHNLTRLRDPLRAALLVREWTGSMTARARRLRPLMKDPIALFSAEWLALTFGMRVVVMIRHPLGFVGSIKRLNWQFKFRGWLAQPALLRDWLHPFEDDMRRCAAEDVDVVEQGILMWNAMHHVIAAYRGRHPGWAFVRHEDLAAGPVESFRSLYGRMGLRWGPGTARAVGAGSSPGNPAETPPWRRWTVRRDSAAATETWRQRLDPDEVRRIRTGVARIAPCFYPEERWP